MSSRCSFCTKSTDDVETLVAGAGVFICNECVDLCAPIVAAETAHQAANGRPSRLFSPQTGPTDQLLRMLAAYNVASESIGSGMQDLVDVLREREVSWAAIGEALGVSRQAAWKRFA